MSTTPTALLLPVLAAVAIASGCGGDDSSESTSAEPVPVPLGTFSESEYTKGGEPQSFVEGTMLEVQIVRERGEKLVRWDVGCNLFGGRLKSEAGEIVLSQIVGTLQLCEPARNSQDNLISRFFESSPALSMEGDVLVLESDGLRVDLEPAERRAKD